MLIANLRADRSQLARRAPRSRPNCDPHFKQAA